VITPQKTFAETAKSMNWRWQDTVDSVQFQSAANAALVQMAINNGNPPDMASAAAYQWRMEGAKQFLGILMGLVAPAPQGRKQEPVANLNHRI